MARGAGSGKSSFCWLLVLFCSATWLVLAESASSLCKGGAHACPQLEELNEIREGIGADYHDVAICLLGDIDGNKLEVIKDEERKVKSKLDETFRLWKKGEGNAKECTWEVLRECLKHADLNALAQRLELACSTASNSANETSSEATTTNQASGTRSSSPTPSYVEPSEEIESASVLPFSIPYFAAIVAIIILIVTTAYFFFSKGEIPKLGETDRDAYMKKIKLPPSSVEQNEPFLNQVKLIVHVVNKNEKWAVLANMEPPDNQDEEDNTTRFIKVETDEGDIKLWLVLGKFGGYKIAVLQTKMGNYCGPELKKAMEILPNVKCVIGVGVAFAFKKEYRLGDVLVSELIAGGSDLKGENGIIQLRNAVSRNISQALTLIFTRDADIWAANINFECNKDGRKSKVHPGGIVSAPLLTNDKKMRDAIYKRFPEAVGGEMEGHMYMKLNDDHECEFEYIIVKGVADYGDGKKNKKWQFTAAMAAANFVKFMLERTEGKMYNEN